MPDEKEPYDLTILSTMTQLNTFRGKSVEEIACLIRIAENIVKEQNLRKREHLFASAHYHVPLNYLVAMDAWTAYKSIEQRNAEKEHPGAK